MPDEPDGYNDAPLPPNGTTSDGQSSLVSRYNVADVQDDVSSDAGRRRRNKKMPFLASRHRSIWKHHLISVKMVVGITLRIALNISTIRKVSL